MTPSPSPDQATVAAALPTVLADLPVGARGTIIGFDIAATQRVRLLEMGLTSGTEIEIVRFAPLGDPIDVKVRGYHLSLRRQEASGIQVARL